MNKEQAAAPRRSKQDIADDAMETLDTLHPHIDYDAYSALADAIQELADEEDTATAWKPTAGDNPPTAADGWNEPTMHKGEVIAIDLQGRASLWPWQHVAKYFLQYPFWTSLPRLMERKEEGGKP